MKIYEQINSKTPQNVFVNWKNHRNKINSYLELGLQDIPSQKLNNVLVIGAGNCNDIDLNFLSSKFSKIYLTDIDIKNLTKSIKEKYPSQIDDFEILDLGDITGLDSFDFYNKIIYNLNNNIEIKVLIQEILKKLDQTKIKLDKYHNFFSAIIILPIYTQLPLPILLNISESTYEKQVSNINIICEFLNLIFNDNIKFLSNKNSLIFAYSDFLDMNMLNKDSQENISKDLYDFNNNNNNLNIFIENIKSKYKDLILLGSNGLNDLKDMSLYSPHLSFLISWPYSSNKTYLCEGFCIIMNDD